MQEAIYFEPIVKERIWGGQRLREYGFSIPEGIPTGEVWTLASHPNGTTRVKSGPFVGLDLEELWSNQPEIFGIKTDSDFPLLLKWIDASTDLSVQVHPNDSNARRYEQQPFGKNECWYIIDCPEDASLIYGHSLSSPEEFDEVVRQGTLLQSLHHVPVSKGDFLYVPAGTVHALTEGCVVLEIQQNSDTTYRLHDYDRLDPVTGTPRTLHIEQARRVIRFPHYRYLEPSVSLSPFRRRLTRNPDFFVEEWTIRQTHALDPSPSFRIITVVEGSIELDDVMLSVGATVLLPAGSKHVVSGDGLMLVTGPATRTTTSLRIGVDLGGTQTRVAVVDQEKVIKQLSFPTNPVAGPRQTISHIEHAIRYFSEEFHLTNIGIAAPGPLDAKTGHLLSPPNLPGWDDVDLVTPISSSFGLPTHLENDANAAALGEALFGAGKTSSSVYYVTVSTGIGGGYVHEKKLIRGANGYAGEIGNTIIDSSGPVHPVLNVGSLEGLASGTALQSRALEKEASSIEMLLTVPSERTRFINHLATGLANIIHTIDPETIIIGGGVTESADVFWEELICRVRELVYPALRSSIDIRLATLQGYAGVIGAAYFD
ncbi:type I phosphomannose isomerase catalytic subunit [Exiguobacterium sp. FSL W8-0210]|uniref:type I phosphomannose isomerase catalytic subunit n=1 Tax=Exiguobacterium sp. FSL W8-0210 TaxID=2921598 RepID=UPI0030FA48A1